MLAPCHILMRKCFFKVSNVPHFYKIFFLVKMSSFLSEVYISSSIVLVLFGNENLHQETFILYKVTMFFTISDTLSNCISRSFISSVTAFVVPHQCLYGHVSKISFSLIFLTYLFCRRYFLLLLMKISSFFCWKT